MVAGGRGRGEKLEQVRPTAVAPRGACAGDPPGGEDSWQQGADNAAAKAEVAGLGNCLDARCAKREEYMMTPLF